MILPTVDPVIAVGVVLSTAATDAVYVFFTASVAARRRYAAALSAFAVISYTSNWAYVLFAALGSWIGGFLSIAALDHAPIRRASHGRRLAALRQQWTQSPSAARSRQDALKSARSPSTSAALRPARP